MLVMQCATVPGYEDRRNVYDHDLLCPACERLYVCMLVMQCATVPGYADRRNVYDQDM